jgi:hypothetical protein
LSFGIFPTQAITVEGVGGAAELSPTVAMGGNTHRHDAGKAVHGSSVRLLCAGFKKPAEPLALKHTQELGVAK